MNLTTATPTQIDTQLAEIDLKLFRATQTAAGADDRVAVYERYSAKDEWSATYYVPALAEARKQAEAATAAVDALHAEAAPLHAEYDRRPWARAWMVMNNGGHAHRTMACATCYPTTRFGWLPSVADMDETQIISALGSDACTVCYPNAPVADLNRPRSVFTLDEQDAQAARDAKAAAKAAKDAVKATKAITAPDGRPLRLSGYGPVNTVRTAEIEYVDDAAYLLACAQGYPAGRVEGATRDTLAVLEALAAKFGGTVEAQRERLAAKVAARYRRDYQ